MSNSFERQSDILSIINGMDISPTLYKNAVEKYQTLGKYLNENGLVAEIYPQGSFAIGTVVRPCEDDSAPCYDLDFICQVTGSRDDYPSPRVLWFKVQSLLEANKTYADRLTINEKCFTINYADIGDISFSIDIVPAADESDSNKLRLAKKCKYPDLINSSIAIPSHDDVHAFEWITNNPKGFRAWFDSVNAPFIASAKRAERLRIYNENRSVFASVEDIPNELERSSLQRVIQILKCHRNTYYSTMPKGDIIKPISAILTVAATEIAANYNPNCTVFELLAHVLTELSVYSKYQLITEVDFKQCYGSKVVFTRPQGEWRLENPANPEDNLVDSWNKDANIPKKFFQWVSVAQADLITSVKQKDDKQFRAILESSFGEVTVRRLLGNKYGAETSSRQIASKAAPKPYHA